MAEPSPYDTYTSPLATRNASPEMLRLWSARHKFNTWRRVWLAVAEAQHELGLPVTKEQVEELRAVVNRPGGITDDEIRLAEKYERELRHDVMAHVHALGDSCPKAKGIIHLGMTSQDVVCNAELMIFDEAEKLIVGKITKCIVALTTKATQFAQMPTLALTHYQPAQPCTVGRRFAMWSSDLVLARLRFTRKDSELYEINNRWSHRPWRGIRGATGTQASFLELCDNSTARVDRLNYLVWRQLIGQGNAYDGTSQGNLLAAKFGAKISTTLMGQTYPRVIDTFILADLASTASVLHKIASDIRLLCNRKELDEPFEDKQIGSSAMPYKRNPMRCERICGLSRFVMNLVGNAYDTAATQWLERTLDDSSNRRLSLPEAFLALDGALDLMHNVASGLIVHEAMVRKNLMAELPFMATENILMACVKAGGEGGRQHYHELIRRHAQAAGLRVKDEGLDNDLLDRLKADPAFHPPALKHELDWDGLLDPMKYVGRSVEQTERFIKEVVDPLREQFGDEINKLGESGPKV